MVGENKVSVLLSGVILMGNLGEKVSLSWLTSPYVELREKWKCIECTGESKIWIKTSSWNPDIVAKLLPLWKLQDDPCIMFKQTHVILFCFSFQGQGSGAGPSLQPEVCQLIKVTLTNFIDANDHQGLGVIKPEIIIIIDIKVVGSLLPHGDNLWFKRR